MALAGSAAFRLNEAVPANVREDVPFVAVEGGGLDARVREGVSPALTRAVSLAVVVVLSLFALGSISVAFTSGAVAILRDNATVTSQIKEVRAANDDLRIECSLLSRADRVSRIATQNLGMVYAADAGQLNLT